MVERAREIEHRSRSEIIQDTLRTHFGEPVYVPTEDERRMLDEALTDLHEDPDSGRGKRSAASSGQSSRAVTALDTGGDESVGLGGRKPPRDGHDDELLRRLEARWDPATDGRRSPVQDEDQADDDTDGDHGDSGTAA